MIPEVYIAFVASELLFMGLMLDARHLFNSVVYEVCRAFLCCTRGNQAVFPAIHLYEDEGKTQRILRTVPTEPWTWGLEGPIGSRL